jgi:DNA-binding phage protein
LRAIVVVRVPEFDPSGLLDNEELIAEYLTAALEDENPDVFLAAVGNVDGSSVSSEEPRLNNP